MVDDFYTRQVHMNRCQPSTAFRGILHISSAGLSRRPCTRPHSANSCSKVPGLDDAEILRNARFHLLYGSPIAQYMALHPWQRSRVCVSSRALPILHDTRGRSASPAIAPFRDTVCDAMYILNVTCEWNTVEIALGTIWYYIEVHQYHDCRGICKYRPTSFTENLKRSKIK